MKILKFLAKSATIMSALAVSAFGQWIQGINVSGVTSTSATVRWTSCALSSSSVNFGTTPSYGGIAGSPTPVTSHAIPLTGLAASTLYHFLVTSVDSTGAIVSSVDSTFTTPNQTASVALNWTISVPISGVTITGYNIYRAAASGGPYGLVGTSTGPPFTDINVPRSDTLFYIARAVATGVESINSSEFALAIP